MQEHKQIARDTAPHLAAKSLAGRRAAVGLVLGSGLGGLAGTLSNPERIPYADIPGMPVSTVAGHEGNLWFGTVAGVPVACLQGRVHAYEGHDTDAVCFGVRVLAALGCHTVLLSNAAGGIGPGMVAGDLMLISDHLNLTGKNPLIGPNDERVGPRFLDMTQAYDAQVQSRARAAAQTLGIALREGVYAGLLGPTYETPAEVRMLAALGASAVGMSTVLETIALRHLGVKVGAISCITNLAAGISKTLLSHAEVQETADRVQTRFIELVHAWIEAVA